MLGTAAIGPRREPREQNSAIGAASGETKARNVEDVRDLGLLQNLLDPVGHVEFVRERGPFGRLNRNDEKALILDRKSVV